jgi:hypothetical protein
MSTSVFSSKAWLLSGSIHSNPGILHLEDNQLTYLMLDYGTFSHNGLKTLVSENGGRIESEPAEFPLVLFSLPTSAISRFQVPWYYFGAGCKLTIERRDFRFSFVKPQNTVEPTYYSEGFMEWKGGKGQEEVNISEGRSVGKSWKRLLSL